MNSNYTKMNLYVKGLACKVGNPLALAAYLNAYSQANN